MDETREALASYAHNAWAGWMQYLFSQARVCDDGSVVIPAALVARWQRQRATPYAQLPENEKASDRVEADMILAIVFPEE